MNPYAKPFIPKSLQPVVSPVVHPIKYDENDLPIYRNPESGQMITFVHGVKNLPKGYENSLRL
jgi:hypothetical protein